MPKKRAHIVSEWLEEQCRTSHLQAGQRLPTEAELEQLLGISRNAVRNGLRQLAEKGWLSYEKNRGYFVTAELGQLQSKAHAAIESAESAIRVGLLCFFPGHYIFPDIISGFSAMLNSKEYHIIIKESEYQVEQERRVLEAFLQEDIAGLVAEPIVDGMNGEQAPNLKLYQQLAKRDIPIIFVDAYVPNLKASSILCHDLQSGREAAQTLVRLGYRDFILFYQERYLAKAKRIEGAKEILKNNKIPFSELVFRGQGQHSDARSKCEVFFQKLPQNKKRSRPMAWICSNDEEAAIVIDVAKDFGWQLHQDYELIAFDNSQLSQLVGGGFSSFTHPGRLMGRMAARYLLDQLPEGVEERHRTQVLVESNLIPRSLCSCQELMSKSAQNLAQANGPNFA